MLVLLACSSAEGRGVGKDIEERWREEGREREREMEECGLAQGDGSAAGGRTAIQVFVLGGGTEDEPEAEKDKDGLKFLQQPDLL